jgi:hypothetical protein
MTVLDYASSDEYNEAFLKREVGAIVPVKLTSKILDLSRARLMSLASQGEELVLIRVKVDDTMINGFTEDSVRSLATKREAREKLLAAATEESVRRHIIDSLLSNGFAEDESRLLEYSAHVMQPFGLSHNVARDREHIGALLGTISRGTWENRACGAMLSAVVINKTGPLKGKPSAGFWSLVESVAGDVVPEKERDAYWKTEIRKLQKYIRKLESV